MQAYSINTHSSEKNMVNSALKNCIRWNL